MKLNNTFFVINFLLCLQGCLCYSKNLRGVSKNRKLESWPEWPNNSYNEVKIPVYNGLCKSAWDRYLIGSAETWSQSKTVQLQVGPNYGPRNLCNNNNDIFMYENYINVVERWEPTWNIASFIQSSVYKEDNKITGNRRFKSAVIILNDAILMNPISPYFSYEMRMKFMCNYLGFALGLYNAGVDYGTINDKDSCMDPTSLSLFPSSYDFKMLEGMYFNSNNRKLNEIMNIMALNNVEDESNNQTLTSESSFLSTHEYSSSEDYNEEGEGSNRDSIDIDDVGDLVMENYTDGVKTKFYVQDNDDFISYAVKIEYII